MRSAYVKLGRGSSRELFYSHHEYPFVDHFNEQYGRYDVSWRSTLTICKTCSFCGCLCRHGPFAQRCSCLHRVLKLCNTHVLSDHFRALDLFPCVCLGPRWSLVRTIGLSCRNSRWRSSRHQTAGRRPRAGCAPLLLLVASYDEPLGSGGSVSLILHFTYETVWLETRNEIVDQVVVARTGYVAGFEHFYACYSAYLGVTDWTVSCQDFSFFYIERPLYRSRPFSAGDTASSTVYRSGCRGAFKAPASCPRMPAIPLVPAPGYIYARNFERPRNANDTT